MSEQILEQTERFGVYRERSNGRLHYVGSASTQERAAQYIAAATKRARAHGECFVKYQIVREVRDAH